MAGLSPPDFWDLSPKELWCILAGWKEFHVAEEKKEPMSGDRFKELQELYPD
jgi:hypothetical protein